MPGSDSKINYNIRPAKSVERKMMCELFHMIQMNLKIADYRYIGLGAKYFADFILLHNEFGFKKMISIEALDNDSLENRNEEELEQLKKRYENNKPFGCIKMEYGFTTDVLPQISWGSDHDIVWLDYDQRLQKYMIDDIKTLIDKLVPGSMFFFSFNSSLKNYKFREKLTELEDALGAYLTPNLRNEDLISRNINYTFKQIINGEISNQLGRMNITKAEEDKLIYKQLLFFKYKDGAPMTTIGGILLNKEQHDSLNAFNLKDKLPFVVDNDVPFDITVPNLTHREIQTILSKLPVCEEDLHKIKLPGVSQEEISLFARIYRYYPHFIEGRLYN